MAWRSRSAAVQDRTAAREARESVRTLASVASLSAAVPRLQEIKALHRDGRWDVLLVRYDEVVQLIAQVKAALRGPESKLIPPLTAFQGMVRELEAEVERIVAGQTADVDIVLLNGQANKVIDGLLTIVEAVKDRPGRSGQ